MELISTSIYGKRAKQNKACVRGFDTLEYAKEYALRHGGTVGITRTYAGVTTVIENEVDSTLPIKFIRQLLEEKGEELMEGKKIKTRLNSMARVMTSIKHPSETLMLCQQMHTLSRAYVGVMQLEDKRRELCYAHIRNQRLGKMGVFGSRLMAVRIDQADYEISAILPYDTMNEPEDTMRLVMGKHPQYSPISPLVFRGRKKRMSLGEFLRQQKGQRRHITVKEVADEQG